jgi:TonB family protein
MRAPFTRLRSPLLLTLASAFLSPFLTAAQSPHGQAALEIKLSLQYAAIQKQFRVLPERAFDAEGARLARRAWQDELARLFSEAAITVEDILKLNPTNAEVWRARLETLRLYAQPITPPDQRAVYGASEVNKKARLIATPNAIYTVEARGANAKDEVRLRLVLASDGTVKNIFPIKSAAYSLTESAVAAAQQIRFEPAFRNGQSVSQFATFVYEFRKKDAKPRIPSTIF